MPGPDDAVPPAGAVPSPDAVSSLGGAGRFDTNLDRLVSDAGTDAAAARRGRRANLRRQAEEEATLRGVLVDLGEHGRRVAVGASSGRRHAGVVRSVGRDACVVATDAGPVVVRLAAIEWVRDLPGERSVDGGRELRAGLRLVDVLADLAAERAVTTVVTGSGEVLAGEIRAVGADVVTLRLDGDPPTAAYLPVAAVAEVWPGTLPP